MDSGISLVVFDLGGVLVRIASGWREAQELAGFEPDLGPRDEALVAAAREHGRHFEVGAMSAGDYLAAVAATAGGFYTPDDIRRIFDAISRDQYEGVEAVFDALDRAGIATGVLSNTNALHWERLAGLRGGPPEYPAVLRAKHLHASHLLGVGKPDRAIYERFAERTGYAPQQILFFDDLERNVAGARDAGWRSERIDPAQATAPQLFAGLRMHGVLG